jgi:hypothetical protein
MREIALWRSQEANISGNVLETSGFNSLIKVYDTEKEAFSAFAA